MENIRLNSCQMDLEHPTCSRKDETLQSQENLRTEVCNLRRLILRQSDEEEEEEEEDGCFSLPSRYSDSESGISMFDGDERSLVTEIPTSMETCLALNQAYQDILQETISELENVLEQNKKQQKKLQDQLANPTTEVRYMPASSMKIGKLASFLQPYFKDIHGFPAPENEDVKIKRANNEITAYVTRPKGWTKPEEYQLQKAVERNALKLAMKPYLDKKEYFMEKLKESAKHSPEVVEAANKAIQDVEHQLAVIKTLSKEELMSSRETPLDWLHISNIDLEKERSPEECELFWKNYLHPSINKDDWTSEEETRLMQLVEKWQGHNWDAIAQELTTNRTAIQCLEHYRMIEVPQKQRGAWTEEEDDLLLEVVNSCSVGQFIPWHQVAYYFDGRTKQSLMSRWFRLQAAGKRKWTIEEDLLLLAGIRKHHFDWVKLSTYFSNRNNQQCRERFHNTLSEAIERRPFTKEEDELLLQLVEHYGKSKWVKLSEFFTGRTDNQLLQRYKRLTSIRDNGEASGTREKYTYLRNPRANARETAEKLLNLKIEEVRKRLEAESQGREVEESVVIDTVIDELQALVTASQKELSRKKANTGSLNKRKLTFKMKPINDALTNYFKGAIQYNVMQPPRKAVCITGTNAALLDALMAKLWKLFKLKESARSLDKGLDPLITCCASEFINKYVCDSQENRSDIPIFPPNLLSVAAFELLLINRTYLQQKAEQAECDSILALLESAAHSVCCVDFNDVFEETELDQYLTHEGSMLEPTEKGGKASSYIVVRCEKVTNMAESGNSSISQSQQSSENVPTKSSDTDQIGSVASSKGAGTSVSATAVIEFAELSEDMGCKSVISENTSQIEPTFTNVLASRHNTDECLHQVEAQQSISSQISQQEECQNNVKEDCDTMCSVMTLDGQEHSYARLIRNGDGIECLTSSLVDRDGLQHQEHECKRCDALHQFHSDYKLLEERFISIFLWPALLSVAGPPIEDNSTVEEKNLQKKKKYYHRSRPLKRPWSRKLALQNAEIRRAQTAMRKQIAASAGTSLGSPAEQPPHSETPSSSAEGATAQAGPKQRGQPKGYCPTKKPSPAPRQYKPRGPNKKKETNLEPTRRSKRVVEKQKNSVESIEQSSYVAKKRKMVDSEVPTIVKRLQLDLEVALNALTKS